ncbi:MAG: TldD/PmbA family protein [Bauldia sp.]|nr:TldD/PmbA family protein [Bauldia sp.]
MNALLSQADLVDRAARLVEAAKKAGADAADAVSRRRVSLGVDVRLGKVEETSRAEGDDFSLRVFVGKRNASVSANVLTSPAELAERAVAMAKAAPEDPYAGLADPATLATTFPDLDLLDATIPTADELTAVALEAEDAARAVPGVTNSGGAGAGWSLGGVVLATSHGFAGSYLASRFSVSAVAIAGEGTGMERDHDHASRIHRSDLPSASEIGRTAGERTVRRLNPGKMPTGRANVVYESRIASSLVGHLVGAISGAAIARKTSFLGDKLGQRVMPAGFRITDDPLRIRGLASRPFDGEGAKVAPLDLVDDGVIMTWILDSTTGRELGLPSNGRAGGTTNMTLLPGTLSFEELIAEVGNGVYVTDLIGSGVNQVTGDYSRGAAGFLIENGQIGRPVNEITIAGNLLEMYPRMVIANDLEYRYATNVPTIAVEGMMIAGR